LEAQSWCPSRPLCTTCILHQSACRTAGLHFLGTAALFHPAKFRDESPDWRVLPPAGGARRNAREFFWVPHARPFERGSFF
jgi:hypothetical protein